MGEYLFDVALLLGIFFVALTFALCILGALLRRSQSLAGIVSGKLTDPRMNLPLEGFRGVLAFVVFFHHWNIFYFYRATGKWGLVDDVPWPNGFVAVNFFFFLTGYLFWSQVLALRGGIPVLSFYRKRFLRLMPAYWVCCAALFLTVGYETSFNLNVPVGSLIQQLRSWLSVGLLSSMFPDINLRPGTMLINAGVFWSLRIEWLFYLVLPLLAIFYTLPRFAFLCLSLLLLEWRSPEANQIAPLIRASGSSIAAACGPAIVALRDLVHFFVFGFLIGAISAYLVPIFTPKSWFTTSGASCIAIFCALFALCGPMPQFSLLSLCVQAVAFLIIASGNSLWGILKAPTMIFLGTISYSVYIVHGLVLFIFLKAADSVFAEEITQPGWYLLTLPFITALVIGGSVILYRWVEHPFLPSKR